jgi:hypothetical protein
VQDISIDIALALLDKIEITPQFIPTLVKSCFSDSSGVQIKNVKMKGIVEKTLKLCKFQGQEPSVLELLDKSVYLKSLYTGKDIGNEESPYLMYIRVNIEQFLDSITDRSI